MIIGRLFVALGIKGGKSAKKEVDGVTGALKKTAGMGLEAKAAILGAVYALEKLTSKSGQIGTNLTNFNATVGVSAQTLQKYQYAARQVGVSNEAVEGTFRNLQASITSTLMGKGAPEGLARVAQVVAQIGKNMSPIDLVEFKDDPSKLIQRLQEYAQLEKDAGLRNATLKSFGLGDDMIAALTRNTFNPTNLAKAPTYSDAEIAQLDKANIAWSNLINKIEMAVGHLNAAHGGKLVSDISKVADEVLRATEAFVKLAEKLKLFEKIGMIFEGWEKIFKGLTKAVDAVNGAVDDPKKAAQLKEDTKGFFSDLLETGKYALEQAADFVGENAPKAASAAGGYIKENAPKAAEAVKDFGNDVRNMAVVAPVLEAIPPSPVKAPRGLGEPRAQGAQPALKLVPPPPGAPPAPGVPEARAVPPGAAVTGTNVAAAPAQPPATIQTQNNTTTVNQSLNFQHDGKDAKQTSDSVKRATQQALRQMPGLAQGS